MRTQFDQFIQFGDVDDEKNDNAWLSNGDIGAGIGAVVIIALTLSFPSWIGGSLHVGLLAGVGVLALVLGFGYDQGFISTEWIGQMLAGWCLATCVEGAGGLRWMTDFIAKWFKHTQAGFSKWRWAWIFIAASMAYLVAIFSGSAAAIAFLMYPLAIEVSKDIGLRPGKAVAGVLIGAQFGEIGSPLSRLFEEYVRGPMNVHRALIVNMFGAANENDMAGNRYMPTNLQLGLVLIPATYIGVLLACTLVIWYGNDLSESKTFKRRLVAGLASCNHPEWYLTDHELQQMVSNMMLRNSKKDGFVMTGDGGGGVVPLARPEDPSTLSPERRPLHDFSFISVLTEGDYLLSTPIIGGDPHVESIDINRRRDLTAGSRSRHSSVDRKPTATLAEDMVGAQNLGPVSRVARPYRTSRQLISLGIATVGVCWVIVYAILRSDAAAKLNVDFKLRISDMDGDISKLEKGPVKILDLGANYLNVIATYLTCSMVVLLACSVPVEQLFLNRYNTQALIGVINATIVGMMFRLLAGQYGLTPVGNASVANAMTKGLAVVPFLAAAFALMFSNYTDTAAVFFLAMTGAAKLPDTTPDPHPEAQAENFLTFPWFVGFIPVLGIVNLLPWHSLSLYAIELDDTRTTRYGKYWLDNSFAGPVFVAAAAATGIAVGIAVAVIQDSTVPMSLWWLRNWVKVDPTETTTSEVFDTTLDSDVVTTLPSDVVTTLATAVTTFATVMTTLAPTIVEMTAE